MTIMHLNHGEGPLLPPRTPGADVPLEEEWLVGRIQATWTCPAGPGGLLGWDRDSAQFTGKAQACPR